MTRDEDRSVSPTPPAGSWAPLGLAATTVGLAVAAAHSGMVPTATAIGGAAVLLVGQWATTRAVRAAARDPASERPRAATRRPWPDAGMKIVVEALDDPCIVVDAAGAVRRVNRAATARFPSLKPGDPLAFGLRIPALRDALGEVVERDAARTVEWQEKVPTERWFRAHLAPMRAPSTKPTTTRPDFVLIRIEDLTEARRVERMRADFVANASHELRTPLAALTGFIETLQGPARDDAVARARFLGVMSEQAWRMKRLIDDLLSLSRVEMRAHLRPEGTVDLAEILPMVIDLIGRPAREAGVRLDLVGCGAALPVRGDRDELTQVFSNLIENAVKYGGAGGRVEIVATPDATGVTVAVRDFGKGIDPVHLPRLTERFYRAHSETTGAKRGTGLGLAIVKHIVTRHGGRLDIASKPGEGSTFTVRLDSATP